MNDIFISYASADRPRVKPLVDALQQQGWSVWWDRTIRAGRTFDRVIEAALKDARCVIVLWSQTSIESDWVRTEADEAKRRGILVPALIDDVEIPLAFRRIQAASLVGWSGALPSAQFDELALAVSEVLSSSASPAPDAKQAAAEKARLEQEERERKAEEEKAQNDELERRRITAENARLDEERRRIAAEQIRLDDERKQVAAEKARLEQFEREHRAAAEKSRDAELERQALAAEKARLEQERQRLSAEQARLNEERQQAAAEKTRLEQQERQRKAAEEKARQQKLEQERQAAEEQARLQEARSLAAEKAQLEEQERQRKAAEKNARQQKLDEERQTAAEQARLEGERRLAAEKAQRKEKERQREAAEEELQPFLSMKMMSGLGVGLVVLLLVWMLWPRGSGNQASQLQTAVQQPQPSTTDVNKPTANICPAGVYCDTDTSLMWTIEDNGKDITWPDAEQYCRSLTLAGLSGWELPTIDELAKLYDYSYDKIRNPLRLTEGSVWSSTARGSGYAWFFHFSTGERLVLPVGSSGTNRALCVRRSGK